MKIEEIKFLRKSDLEQQNLDTEATTRTKLYNVQMAGQDWLYDIIGADAYHQATKIIITSERSAEVLYKNHLPISIHQFYDYSIVEYCTNEKTYSNFADAIIAAEKPASLFRRLFCRKIQFGGSF